MNWLAILNFGYLPLRRVPEKPDEKMPKELNNDSEGKEWVMRYEAMLRTQQSDFLDLDA